ncbi:toll/interleukin-1 receptor domain-containing protein [Sphingopyxis sp.]|uniref:toll/interleukin-1 receptor domain-containing protein n=1 Tax=Sphingopyxis sp. TaxID=1908224 RepID=UPI003D0CE7C6
MTAEGSGAPLERPYDIFISYSRADTDHAVKLRDLLIARGHHVFFDAEGIDAGAEFPDVIDRAVKGAKVVLGCWTPAAIQRRWVRIESRIGLDRGSLVAIALEKIDPEALPAEFYNVNVLNMSDFDGSEAHPAWQRVLVAIDRRLNKATAAPTADDIRPAGPKKRRFSPLALGSAAALAIAAVGGGGWYFANSAPAFDQAAVAASFDKTVKSTEPVMANALVSALNDAETNTNGKIFWALAQLIAVEKSPSAEELQRFDAAVTKFLGNPCHCVVVEGAPFTIVSTWTLTAYGAMNRAPPAPVVDALLAAQNREGWWSSAMDAADRPDNAATYITALTVIALRDVDPVLKADAALQAKVRAARGRAVEWLKRRRPNAGVNWADYPDNSLRTESASISAMATLALLPDVDAAEAKEIAATFVAGLDKLPPADQNFSNDINVIRTNGETYVETYRHVPLGWEVHALAESYPLLTGEAQAKAARLLGEAQNVSLSDPKLARQDWMLAEQFLGLRGARDALAKKAAASK